MNASTSDCGWLHYGDRARARRAAARQFHPDLGGDTADFVAALNEIDRVFDRRASGDIETGAAPAPVGVYRSRFSATMSGWWRRQRGGAGVLLRRRRYFDL